MPEHDPEIQAEIQRIADLAEAIWDDEQLLFAIIVGANLRTAGGINWEAFREICKVPDEDAYRVPASRLQMVQDFYRGIVAPGLLDYPASAHFSSGKFTSQRLAFICQKFFWRTMSRVEFKAFVDENPLKYSLKFYTDPTDDEWLESHDFPLFGPSPFTESIQSVFVQP